MTKFITIDRSQLLANRRDPEHQRSAAVVSEKRSLPKEQVLLTIQGPCQLVATAEGGRVWIETEALVLQ